MEKFLPPAVNRGDKWRDSASFGRCAPVKLLARTGEGNKPRFTKPYNLQQTLY